MSGIDAAGGTQGDRTTMQNGMTAIKTPGVIKISSWELKSAGMCQQICLAIRCSQEDKTRSYLYIRSNGSIEFNDANGIKACCTCCFEAEDNISVNYFDRAPYKPTINCGPFPWCCIIYCGAPKIEIVDNATMCCCVKMDPCCLGKQAVIMPFEQLPPPCCCCSNRTSAYAPQSHPTCCSITHDPASEATASHMPPRIDLCRRCDNCFNLCGPVVGNPKIFFPFSPQPKNASAFVAAAQQAMQIARASGAPESLEIDR